MMYDLKEVETFWDKNPCGNWPATDTRDRKEYFLDIAAYRLVLFPVLSRWAVLTNLEIRKY